MDVARPHNSKKQQNLGLDIYAMHLHTSLAWFTCKTYFQLTRIRIPIAIVLSKRETHDNVPGTSSTTGLPFLEPGLVVGLCVVNATIRTAGRLYRTSIRGSGFEAGLAAGRLKARRATGVVGLEEAIATSSRLVITSTV